MSHVMENRTPYRLKYSEYKSNCVKVDGEYATVIVIEEEPSKEVIREWGGGECPVNPMDMVKVFTRRGGYMYELAGSFNWGRAEYLSGSDIVAYVAVSDREARILEELQAKTR